MKTSKPLYIKVHATDNVAIVVNSGGLPAGTVFDDGLTLREHEVRFRAECQQRQ